MSRHSVIAGELFEKGYNCAQSVFAAFCDETGVDFETALKLSSSFGGARLRYWTNISINKWRETK